MKTTRSANRAPLLFVALAVFLLVLASVSPVAAAENSERHSSNLVAVFDKNVPANVQVVVNDVMGEIDDVVAFNPAGTVQIQVSWADIGSLGLGGPIIVKRKGSFYPAALADTLFGGQHASGSVDGTVTLGSGKPWYYGLDGRTPSNLFDMRTAFEHELLHALGFTLETQLDGQGRRVLSGRTTVFDQNLSSGGRPMLGLGASDQSAAFANDDVWFDIGGGRLLPLQSSAGSSQSHFAYAVSLFDDEPGALLYAGLVNGVSHRLDGPSVGALAQLGYPITARPEAPREMSVTSTVSGPVARWSIDLSPIAPPPAVVEVEWRRRGVKVGSAEVEGAVSQYAVSRVGSADQIVLTAVSSSGVRSLETSASISTQGTIVAATSIAQIVAASDYRPEHGDVLRLYWAFFNREPDVGGARYWLGLYDGGVLLDAIATQFASSAEFRGRYGSVSAERYVEVIYLNVLQRPRDNNGFEYWLGLLKSGRLDRGGIVRWIAAAPEFVNAHPYR